MPRKARVSKVAAKRIAATSDEFEAAYIRDFHAEAKKKKEGLLKDFKQYEDELRSQFTLALMVLPTSVREMKIKDLEGAGYQLNVKPLEFPGTSGPMEEAQAIIKESSKQMADNSRVTRTASKLGTTSRRGRATSKENTPSNQSQAPMLVSKYGSTPVAQLTGTKRKAANLGTTARNPRARESMYGVFVSSSGSPLAASEQGVYQVMGNDGKPVNIVPGADTKLNDPTVMRRMEIMKNTLEEIIRKNKKK